METQKIENKTTWRDEYLKIIASLANSDGGILNLGINDNNEIIGIENIDKLLEDLPNKIRNRLFITPSISVNETENKRFISIQVQPTDFPVFYDGKVFIRSGSTTQELSGSELLSFLLSKTGRTWDSIEIDASMNELNKETIQKFIQLSKSRLPLIETTDEVTLLKNLGLIKDKYLTRAALLLFGKNPQSFFISAYARGGRFKNSTVVIDSKDFGGNLFEQLENAIEFVKKHISVRFEIKVNNLTLEDISRKDIWDYPLEAIREAIINALIHRDYCDTSSTVEIRIYDDQIIVSNPGKLIPPLKVEDLKIPHQTKPRNPLLAKVFYYAGFIEQWGSGTIKMINLCKEMNIPEPEFEERTEGIGSFKIVFQKDIYTDEYLRKLGFNERQIKAVMFVKERGSITNKEYQTINKVSRQMATIELRILIEKNIFKKFGTTGRGTVYKLKEI